MEICKRCKINPINLTRSKNYCTECLEEAKLRTKSSFNRLSVEEKSRRTRNKYLKHKDAILERSKVYSQNHPEIVKKSKLNYSKNNSAKISKISSEYKKNHREHYNLLQRVWRELFPEKSKVYQEKRRSLILGNIGTFTEDEWKSLCDFYGNKCLRCGRSDLPLTVDHVVPLSRDGTNFIDNIQPLCRSCNSSKGTKILDFRPFGSAILSWT